MSNKTDLRAKNDFNLHVSLIMRQRDCSKSQAVFIAWLEGRNGLEDRLPHAPEEQTDTLVGSPTPESKNAPKKA